MEGRRVEGRLAASLRERECVLWASCAGRLCLRGVPEVPVLSQERRVPRRRPGRSSLETAQQLPWERSRRTPWTACGLKMNGRAGGRGPRAAGSSGSTASGGTGTTTRRSGSAGVSRPRTPRPLPRSQSRAAVGAGARLPRSRMPRPMRRRLPWSADSSGCAFPLEKCRCGLAGPADVSPGGPPETRPPFR